MLLACWGLAWLLGQTAGTSVPPAGVGAGIGAAGVRVAQLAPAVLCLAPGGAGPLLAVLAGGAGGVLQAVRTSSATAARPRLGTPDPDGPSVRLAAECGAVLRMTGWARHTSRGWRSTAVVVALGDATRGVDDSRPDVGDAVQVAGEGDAPPPGALVAGAVRWTPPRRRSIPDGFDHARFLAGRGVTTTGRLLAPPRLLEPDAVARAAAPLAGLRGTIEAALIRWYPPRESALLAGVLLGRRGDDAGVPRDAFGALGLAHLFAVSGLHVGIVGAVLGVLALGLGGGPSRRAAPIVVGIAVYVLLTGAASSTVRAAAMATGAVAAPILGRRRELWRLLAVVFWATQVWLPASGGDTGLRLSFLAVAGIAAAAVRAPRGLARPWGWLAAGLGVSCGAQVGTSPEVAASFGWLSPWAPLVNLAAVPVFGFAVWCGVLGLAASPLPWLAEGPALMAWSTLRALEGGAVAASGMLGSPPGIEAWGVMRWAAWLILWGAWIMVRGRGRWLAVVILVALPYLRSPADGFMTVLQADVGQGDAAAFVFPDGAAVLVDTGEAWEGGAAVVREVLPWLRRRGVRRLEAVALTHAHADHDGAALLVEEAMPVERWALGGSCTPPSATASWWRPADGDTLHAAGPWALVCLANGGPPEVEHENDRSLALGLFRDGILAGVWTGDLETEGEHDLLARRLAGRRSPDLVLKAGHHGSATSSSAELLAALRPALVLISCGEASRHGHPSHGPFLVDGRATPTLRTDLLGGLVLRWDAEGRLETRSTRAFVPSP